MDRVGTYMCLATVPMALLSAASMLAGAALLAWGRWEFVAVGFFAFAACSAFAQVLEWLIIALDDSAAWTLERSGLRKARPLAIAAGAVPVAVILGWEVLCFRLFSESGGQPVRFLSWLWSYGIATGPWTVYAMRVSRFRRTLVGIRAYAGHLAYWLLSLAALAGIPQPLTVAVMLAPAILPFAVGMLLALADRQALTNVRV